MESFNGSVLFRGQKALMLEALCHKSCAHVARSSKCGEVHAVCSFLDSMIANI